MAATNKDPYTEFAFVYDEWQALFPQPFALALRPWVRRIAQKKSVPERTLADLACGTGTFAHWWAAMYPDWEVWGLDGSEAMVRHARKAGAGLVQAHLPEGTRSTLPASRFQVQSLTSFTLPQPVGLATCLFDSLNHVTRVQDLSRIFRRVYKNLLPGGYLLFDLVDETDFDEIFTGGSVLEGEDLYVGIESEIYTQRGANLGHAIFSFFRRMDGARAGGGGRAKRSRKSEGSGSDTRMSRSPGSPEVPALSRNRWKKFRAVIVERCWTEAAVRPLAERAGLDVVSVDRIDPEDVEGVFVPRSFWVCRRGE